MTKGVRNSTLVPAHHVALQIQIITGRIGLSGVLFQERNIVSVRYKANILTVLFLCVQKALRLCDQPDLCLGKRPEREERVGQLMLSKAVEKIGLIFVAVHCLFQCKASGVRILLNSGVVTGDDEVATHLLRLVQEFGEFQPPVAYHAGVGGQPGLVAGGEMIRNAFAEIISHVKDIEGHAQFLCNALGVLGVDFSAAFV